MNLIEVLEQFPDQEACIKHLEKLRWGDEPRCVHCDGTHVKRRNETKTGRIGRWNCHDCKVTYKVVHGTVFHGTKIPLQKWFMAVALMANAKKSLSSCQLARDLDLNQLSAWYMMVRIRSEMANEGNSLLKGIIEADETYVGGKPRKRNKRENDEPSKRGRGTSKDTVIGAVQRGGEVVAQVMDNLTGRNILDFIKGVVDMEKSELMTDEFLGYRTVGKEMKHSIVNHKEQFVDGEVHTNTIEGFWSLLKRAWYGQHHHYNTVWTPLYVAEACYKYNNRHTDIFWKFINGVFKGR